MVIMIMRTRLGVRIMLRRNIVNHDKNIKNEKNNSIDNNKNKKKKKINNDNDNNALNREDFNK